MRLLVLLSLLIFNVSLSLFGQDTAKVAIGPYSLFQPTEETKCQNIYAEFRNVAIFPVGDTLNPIDQGWVKWNQDGSLKASYYSGVGLISLNTPASDTITIARPEGVDTVMICSRIRQNACGDQKWSEWSCLAEPCIFAPPINALITGYTVDTINGTSTVSASPGGGQSYQKFVSCDDMATWTPSNEGCIDATLDGSAVADCNFSLSFENGCEIMQVSWEMAGCAGLSDSSIIEIPTPNVTLEDTTGFGQDSTVTFTFDNTSTDDVNGDYLGRENDEDTYCLVLNLEDDSQVKYYFPSQNPNADIDVSGGSTTEAGTPDIPMNLANCLDGSGGSLQVDWACLLTIDFGAGVMLNQSDGIQVSICTDHNYSNGTVISEVSCDTESFGLSGPYSANIADASTDGNGIAIDHTGDQGDPGSHFEWTIGYNSMNSPFLIDDATLSNGVMGLPYGSGGTATFSSAADFSVFCPDGGYFIHFVDEQADPQVMTATASMDTSWVSCDTLVTIDEGTEVNEDISDDLNQMCSGALTYSLVYSNNSGITLTGSVINFPDTLSFANSPYQAQINAYCDGDLLETVVIEQVINEGPCLDGLCSDCCLEPVVLQSSNRNSFGGSAATGCPAGSVLPNWTYNGTGSITAADFTASVDGNSINLVDDGTGTYFESDACISLSIGIHEYIVSGTDDQGLSFSNTSYIVINADLTEGNLLSNVAAVNAQNNPNGCRVAVGWKKSSSNPNDITIVWDDGNTTIIEPGDSRNDYESAGEGIYMVQVGTDYQTEGVVAQNNFEISISCN